MPTTYKRKGSCARATWSEEDMKLAIQAVTSGNLGVNAAARQFKVPCTTLRRKIRTGVTKNKRLGPQAVLGEENERKIVAHIKKMQKRGFAPTRTMVRIMAYQLAEKLGIKHTFNRRNEKAGFDWVISFLRRNPDLTVRKSEGVSLARARGMNKEDVANYFKLLGNILEEHDLFNKPGHLYNMDETGLQLNNRPEHVIAEKGSKNVAAVTSGEKGETVTVISCCNAEGAFIPPTCILKGKNMKKEYEDGMPPGAKIYMSEKSAYINTSLFLKWLQSEFVPRKHQGPVVLILDGHASHCSSVEVLEYAEANDVILICLPSHTTQFLQPLDRAFFKALKSYYYAACNSFLRTNPTRAINRLQFGKLLAEAWEKPATVKNAVSAFRSTGIAPFNPNAIPEYAFLNNEQAQDEINLEIVHIENDTDSNVTKRNAETKSADMANLGTNEKETPGKMLDVISPIPRTSKVNEVRKRSRQLAEVLTSPENICKQKELATKKAKSLVNKEKKKQRVESKVKTKKQYKIDISDTSSNSDESIILENDSDSGTDGENDCIGCGENYEKTTSKEDWLQCLGCHRWLHEGCTTFANHCLRCGRKENIVM